jgi:threonine dehydrogenase-like Zn-dependent dehydrogenase
MIQGPITIPSKERTHPITGESFHVTMGHEFSGRIISAPSDSGLKPGQAVMVDPRIYCTNCSRCTAGSTQCCTSLGFKGLSGAGGGFSETIAVDAKMCYPLPDDIDLSLATLIEPLAVAWHAVADSAITEWPDRSVLIVGGGPVGVAHIFVLRALGCRNIFVSEPTKTRAAQNKKIADAVFNPITESVGESCRTLTGGEGVDVVFDCAGIQAGFDVGMDALRFKGTYMNVAVWLGSPVCMLCICLDQGADKLQMIVPFIPFMLKEITLKCSLAYNDDEFKETVDAFIAGESDDSK